MRENLGQFRRHQHVGGFLGVFPIDPDLPSANPAAQEQRGGELRTLLDGDPAFACFGAGTMDEGGQLVIRGVNAVAEGAQGLEQRGLRSHMHSRRAAESVNALAKTQHGRQEASGRS